MKPTPRPDARRRAYLKDHFKRFKLKEFRIDAPHFLRQIQREYASEKLSVRRKLMWGELYDHIGKRWTISQFDRNLLQHELNKRKQVQQFYDGMLYRHHITERGFAAFAKAALSALHAGIILSKTTKKKNQTPHIDGMQKMMELAAKGIEETQAAARRKEPILITPSLVQTVLQAHLLVLQKQFGPEFSSQIAEAERFTHEWLSRQR